MRKTELIVAAVAGLGLMFAIVAEAAQDKITRYAPSKPTEENLETSAWQAQKEWADTSWNEEMRVALASPSDNSAGDAQDFDKIFDKLSKMETAAGPGGVDLNAAADTVRRLGHDALAVLNDQSLNSESKKVRFQQLLARDFDMPLIARFALGHHWRGASDTEKRAYVQAFSRFVLQTYAGQLTDASIQSFRVTGSQPAGKRDVMVETEVTRSGGGILKLVWRLRSRDGAYRVIDVVAEGISLALTKRQEFAAIIRSNGGRVSPLIDTLRNRAT